MIFADQTLLYLLAGVPVLALWLLARLRRRGRLLAAFGQTAQVRRLVGSAHHGIHLVRAMIWTAAALMLVLVLARPQFGEVEETILARGVDVIIAVDVSASMHADDVQPTRLQRARTQLADLVSRLRGHRVGIMAFAGAPVLQCPLTLDQATLHQTLSIVDSHAVGVPGTAIADAVRLAVASFDEDSPRHRVLVLLTDGEDHPGEIREVAREAREENVTIFAVGIGTTSGSAVPDFNARTGRVQGYRQDDTGNPVVTRLETLPLLELAQTSGGRAFRTQSLGQAEIDAIAREIAALPQREIEEQRIHHREEQFQVFLLPAILLLLLDTMLLTGRRPSGVRACERASVRASASGNSGGHLARAASPPASRAGKATAAALVLALHASLLTPHSLAIDAARENNAGVAAHREGDLAEALALYQRAEVEAPGTPEILLNIGSALYASGEYEAAASRFIEAIGCAEGELEAAAHTNLGATRTRRAQAIANEGNVEGALQEIDQSIVSLRRALEANPDDGEAKYNLEFAHLLRDLWLQQREQQEQQGDEDQEGEEDQQPGDQQSQNQQSQDQGNEDESSQEQSQQPQEQEQQGEGDQQEDQQEGQDQQQQDLAQQMADEAEQRREQAETRLDLVPFEEYPDGMRRLLGVRPQQRPEGPDW